ncbi:MAG: hypothetical protein IT385_08420 [Deltaproteobacteria bacterium]|nr:hypothetical protein [Deltaproteobacteria bacterium]
MATFEVTIDSADARPLRLLVAAEHWVEAWQEGLVLLGDDPSPTDASCVLDDLTAHIEVPSSGRTFIVRPAPRGGPKGPTPSRGQPVVLAGDTSGTPAITVKQKRPGPPPESLAPPRGAPAAPPAPDEDPLARVLSALERQRLAAHPVRFDARGVPQPLDPRPSPRRATPQGMPRAHDGARRGQGAADGSASERPTRDETLAFASAAGAPEALPQLFRPIHLADAADLDVPTARLAALQWAVDTAWHHIPCALALLLEGLHDAPEVAFARGEREREARGCHVPLVHAFRQIACLAPTRVRFADGAGMRFVSAGGQAWDLVVRSTLCAPISFVPGHPSPATAGLGLVLINSTRSSGFIDSELRALTYLARTLAARLDGL